MREYCLSGKPAPRRGTQAAKPLPCQSRTNSTGEGELSPYGLRKAHALRWNVARAAVLAPINSWFLTLTVGRYEAGKWLGVSEVAEVSKRWNSLRRHLVEWLGIIQGVVVPERHASGAIHLHVFFVSSQNYGAGFSWDSYLRARKAKSMPERRARFRALARQCPTLGKKWAILRKRLNAFGFGRHELTPVQKPEAAGEYLGKYLAKGSEGESAGSVRYFGAWRESKERLCRGFMLVRGWSWASNGGRVHRAVIGALATMFGIDPNEAWEITFQAAWGKRWMAVIHRKWRQRENPGAFCYQMADLSALIVTISEVEAAISRLVDLDSTQPSSI